MVEVDRLTTPANIRWKLIDRETGAENAAIDWRFTRRRPVKIRLLNQMAVITRCTTLSTYTGGTLPGPCPRWRPEPNLVWKDTVLDPHRGDRGHPARRHEPRQVDGALPHRRTSRERHDVQLRRDG